MGMTIEKTIEFFNRLEWHTLQAKDARDVAIETMRKYQKIEQIIDDWTKPEEIEWKIREVLEDGSK